MSDTEPEDDSDNEDDGILNAFTATINHTEGIVEDVDEEEELVESKFEKMDEQDDIHTTYAKLYKVLEKHEKLYRDFLSLKLHITKFLGGQPIQLLMLF